MLSGYAKREWTTIVAIGAMLAVATAVYNQWLLVALVIVATVALVAFFRDPERRVPTQRGLMVSPADGRVSSVHRVEHFEPFGAPAMCVRVFMSVLDVHVNRSPCHGIVESVVHKPGEHVNALNPKSAEVNESVRILLVHPIRRHPVAAVRQVAGVLARTIVCRAKPDKVLQRGQRFGIVKLGSTVELYIPESANPQIAVEQGQRVRGGLTVLAHVGAILPDSPRQQNEPEPATAAPAPDPDAETRTLEPQPEDDNGE